MVLVLGTPQKDAFYKKAKKLGRKLKSWNVNEKVLVIGHRDGDGMAAASVSYQGLRHLGFQDIEPVILLSPEEDVIDEYLNEFQPKYVLTCDICSSFDEFFATRVEDYIITDHHPNKSNFYGPNNLNCIEFGFEDEKDASGSTTVFCLFFPLFPLSLWETKDGQVMISHAIAGAMSDFQFTNDNITGINEDVVKLGVSKGALIVSRGINLFGRSMYPVHVTLSRANIPQLTYVECLEFMRGLGIHLKNGDGLWRRIVDLTKSEQQRIIEELLLYLKALQFPDPIQIVKRLILGNTFDLPGLKHLPCTDLEDGRKTLDPREIYHVINYCCRRGKAHLAFQLLNFEEVEPEVIKEVRRLHLKGDQEIVQAIQAVEAGKIQMDFDFDGRFLFADFTDVIYYDQVGVAAGVIMNIHPQLELVASACHHEYDMYKVSVRASERVWNSTDNSGSLADANRVFEKTKEKLGIDFQSGGHRFACSAYIPKTAIHVLVELLKEYYSTLKFTR